MAGLRQELRQSVTDCMVRGLTSAAKWSAQLLAGVEGGGDDAGDALPSTSGSTGSREADEDAFKLARACFELKASGPRWQARAWLCAHVAPARQRSYQADAHALTVPHRPTAAPCSLHIAPLMLRAAGVSQRGLCPARCQQRQGRLPALLRHLPRGREAERVSGSAGRGPSGSSNGGFCLQQRRQCRASKQSSAAKPCRAAGLQCRAAPAGMCAPPIAPCTPGHPPTPLCLQGGANREGFGVCQRAGGQHRAAGAGGRAARSGRSRTGGRLPPLPAGPGAEPGVSEMGGQCSAVQVQCNAAAGRSVLGVERK